MQSRQLWVEAASAAAPAAVVLAIMTGLARAGPLVIALAVLVGLGLALALACWRIAGARRFRIWLEATVAGEPAPSPEVSGLHAPAIVPARELARRLKICERRLKEHGERLGTIVAAMPDPLLLLDRGLVIRLTNPAAERTFGLRLRDLPLARALRDPGVLAAVNAALATGNLSNVVFSPAADRSKQFAARVGPIDLDDSRGGVVITLREQTEQVMIERMRSDFVANASHEIRTPLAAVVGIVETLRGPAKQDPEARDMFLATLAAEVARLQRLVEDLLSLSQIELAAHRPPEDFVDIAQVVEDVAERMRPLAERAEVELRTEVAGDLPSVRADADQLHQLLGNLVDNAIKYGGAGKVVTIAARRLGAAPLDSGPLSGRPCLVLSVSDQGEGIAAEHLPRITERFYRVDRARSRRIGGTGLGLAIVKHIARRHEAHLAIESVPGNGSRFSLLMALEPEYPISCHAPVTNLS